MWPQRSVIQLVRPTKNVHPTYKFVCNRNSDPYGSNIIYILTRSAAPAQVGFIKQNVHPTYSCSRSDVAVGPKYRMTAGLQDGRNVTNFLEFLLKRRHMKNLKKSYKFVKNKKFNIMIFFHGQRRALQLVTHKTLNMINFFLLHIFLKEKRIFDKNVFFKLGKKSKNI